jgi:signal transduction histidine kinase
VSLVASADADRVGSLCKLVLLARLVTLNVTIFEVLGHPDRAPAVFGALFVAALASYVPLRRWEEVGPVLMSRPLWVAGDLGLTMTIFGYLGTDSPFFLYTLGCALLGGVLYGMRGAAIVSGVLLATYYGLLGAKTGTSASSFQSSVTLPVLYPLAAVGGAAVRRLLDRQAETEAALLASQRAAVAGAERTRVAREMHDSLGKTLYGISLSARALAARVSDVAPGAADGARELARAAQIAAGEARELISDLRSDALELPLGAALHGELERWSAASGVAASFAGEEVDLPHPGTRYELFSIVKEALRNVEAHAGASSVSVSLAERDGVVELRVADDGRGFDAQSGPPAGHFGIIGMVERGERVGATVDVESAVGSGTAVVVRVPSGDVRMPEPWAAEAVHS